MNILENLNDIRNKVAEQLDNIDVSQLPKDKQIKLKTHCSKIKANILSGSVDLQRNIQELINEVQGFK